MLKIRSPRGRRSPHARWSGPVLAALALFAAAPPSGLSAQGAEDRSGRGYFQMGVHTLDLAPLNDRLAAQGIPTFSNRFVTLGFGGHAERGRLLIGGEGHGLLEQSETAGAFQRKLSGGYGFFDLGYLLTRAPTVRVYTLLGVGAGGMNLEATERSLPSFDDVLAEPRRGSDLAIGALLLQFGAGAEYIARLSPDAERVRGLALGVRAGYVLAPWKSEWNIGGSEVPGGPSLGLDGFYLRFSLGGAGGRRR